MVRTHVASVESDLYVSLEDGLLCAGLGWVALRLECAFSIIVKI